jgi:hypothetical protein
MNKNYRYPEQGRLIEGEGSLPLTSSLKLLFYRYAELGRLTGGRLSTIDHLIKVTYFV